MNHPKPKLQHGFTMIEVLVVVLVMGLLAKIVVSNAGAWLPESSLDSQANQFRSWVDYLRSESKMSGKKFSFELDLDKNRMRLVLPPEDKLVTTEDDTLATTIPLQWTELVAGVAFHGHSVAGRSIHTKGIVPITFDENGFTADQSLYFTIDEPDPQMVWSVQIHGLSGTTEVIRNREGRREPFRAIEQSNF